MREAAVVAASVRDLIINSGTAGFRVDLGSLTQASS